MRVKHGLLCVSLLALAVTASAQTVWQLGDAGAKDNGFLLNNYEWEYARFPYLKATPGFDPETNVFTYEVKDKGAAKAKLPQYFGSPHYRYWMAADECVTGLSLVWDEAADGFRKIEVNVVESKDRNGLPDDFRAALPDGQVVYFQIPQTSNREISKTPLVWTAEFAVKKGVNRLQLDDVMNTRENFARLNAVKLSVVDKAAVNAPVVEARTGKLGNVFRLGENAEAEVSLFNPIPEGTQLKSEVSDWNGKVIEARTFPAANGVMKLPLPAAAKGWFGVKLSLEGADGKPVAPGNSFEMAYAVLEKPFPGLQPDSFFGCVPMEFGGKPVYWKEGADNLFRLAKLAGFGWARIHSFDYGAIQPERDGKPDWSLYDSVVDIAGRNDLCLMGTICYSPKWATDAAVTPGYTMAGQQSWRCSTPQIPLWRDWCGKIAARYKGRIKYWEIWNEANYVSCYWLSGSASEYAALLESSYESIKVANPEALTYTSFAGQQYRFLADVLAHLDGKRAFDLLGFHYCNPDSAAQWHATLGKTFDSPLIDTEQSLYQGPDDRRQVESVLKLAAYPAHGVVKTILYDSVRAEEDDKWSIIRSSGSPRPAFAAMRTLTHRLEGAKFVGTLPLGSEVKAYLFAKGSAPLVVAWCERKDGEERGVEKDLRVGGGEVKLVDAMDNESPAAVVDGALRLQLGSMPVFVEGGELAVLKELCALDIAVNPAEPVLLAGGEDIVEFSLANRSGRALKVELGFSTKSALKLGTAAKTLELKAGETAVAPLELSIAKELGRVACPLEVGVSYAAADGKPVAFTLPLTVNTTLVPPGENLLGAFDASNWQLYAGVSWLPGGGVKCVNVKGKGGSSSFAHKEKIPVLPGDRYALIGDAKSGEAKTWSVVQHSLFDAKGAMVFPAAPGGNLLTITPDQRWKPYGDTFKIERPDAKELSLFFCNSFDKPGEVYWNDVRLVQLTGKVNLAKAMWQADCPKAAAPPKIDADLSDWKDVKPMVLAGGDPANPKAFGYARWDDANLYLAFRVRDAKFHQLNTGFNTYDGDSIEFAVDPTMDGKDYNEYGLALTPEGPQLFRRHCFVTPELLQTMYFGVVKEAEAAVKHEDGFINYELRLPLTSVHPLRPAPGLEFGLAWVVDDNNGDGRHFYEWAEGIAQTKDPMKYGMSRCGK